MSFNKSACFYCSHNFNTEAVYIPTEDYNTDYGYFCSPNCAAAFLLNEPNISNNTKIQRFEMLQKM
jgi:YHS domain-containing protein